MKKHSLFTRSAAILLTAILTTTALGGCGKQSTKKDKQEEADGYVATLSGAVEVPLYDTRIQNDILYGLYNRYDEATEESQSGLLVYDFAKGESLLLDIEKTELPELYVESYLVDAAGQISIHATASRYDVTEDGTDGVMPLTEDGSELDGLDSYTYIEQVIDLVYNEKLELISRKEGEPHTVTNSMEEPDESNDEYTYNTLTLSDGRIVEFGGMSTAETSNGFVKVLDKEKKELGRITLEDDMGGTIVAMADDSVYLTQYGEESLELYQLDLQAYSLGKPLCKLDYNSGGQLYAGPDQTLLLNQDGHFAQLDVKTGNITRLFSFLNCNINPDNLLMLYALSDGTLGCLVSDYTTDSTEIYTIQKQDPKTAVKKTQLHLATMYTDSQIQEQVIAFNKSQENYQIVVDAYMDYSNESETSYEDAQKQLLASILSGNGPDLIDLNTINYPQLIQKGVLEDLLPYIESDKELSADLFVPSVFNTYKTGNSLYLLPTCFNPFAYVGATSVIGDAERWTMSEFLDFAEGLPEGTSLLQDMTCDGLLSNMLILNMNQYINWETGECSFDTPEFIRLLEFCKKQPTSEQYYADYDYENAPSEVTLIRNKQLALMQLDLYDMSSYLMTKATFGEPFTVRGLPTEKGNGISVISGGSLIGISAKSAHKDACWEFLRTLYSEEEQTSWHISGLPIRKDCLRAVLEQSKQPAGDTENIYTTWGFEDIELTIPYATDADIDEVLAIIDRIDAITYYDDATFSLISEEASAFFEGQKSAAEVAKTIQSRISVYVKEHR